MFTERGYFDRVCVGIVLVSRGGVLLKRNAPGHKYLLLEQETPKLVVEDTLRKAVDKMWWKRDDAQMGREYGFRAGRSDLEHVRSYSEHPLGLPWKEYVGYSVYVYRLDDDERKDIETRIRSRLYSTHILYTAEWVVLEDVEIVPKYKKVIEDLKKYLEAVDTA